MIRHFLAILIRFLFTHFKSFFCFYIHHFLLITEFQSSPILFTLTPRSFYFPLYLFLVIPFFMCSHRLIGSSFLHSSHIPSIFHLMFLCARPPLSLQSSVFLSPILPLLSPFLDNHHLNILSIPPSISIYLFIYLFRLKPQWCGSSGNMLRESTMLMSS